MEDKTRVVLLGVRGSLPVFRPELFGRYGGDTMCVLLQMAGENILLDAGSGLANFTAPKKLDDSLTILLSHPHIDHLLGLPMAPFLFEPGRHVSLWTEKRGELGGLKQAEALMSPPLWPITPKDFRAEINWQELPEGPVFAGSVRIDHAPGNHPGGVTAFRLSAGGVSVVYATDCELDEDSRKALVPFAADCDLLLCDAQFTDKEYTSRVGWGHSSVSMALEFAADCGARRTVLIHHSPLHSDAILDDMAARAARSHIVCSFGRQGEEFFV